MKNVLIGFFSVPGIGVDSVETPLIGQPQAEHQALNKLIMAKHPKVDPKTIVRTGTAMESRGGDDSGPVLLTPGLVLGDLFEKSGEASERRKIGRTFMSGSPYDILLVHHRAQGIVSFLLKAMLKNDSDLRLPNKISPQRLAEEIPQLVKEVLGDSARDTRLDIKDPNPKTKV